MTMNDTLRGVLARGYCTERNKGKVEDPELIEDMAQEVKEWLKEKLPKIARTSGCYYSSEIL